MKAGLLGHLGAAVGYLLLTLLVVWWEHRTLAAVMLAIASLAMCFWGAAGAYDIYRGIGIGWIGQVLEILRSCAWIILLLSLLYWIPAVQRSSWAVAIVGICMCVAVLTMMFGADDFGDAGLGYEAVILGHLIIPLIGLALVENLFRNSPQTHAWSFKHLCFGAGAIFAYDFYLYSDALLFRRADIHLFLARGVTNLIAVPLFALHAWRNREIGPRLAVSRQFVFHSTTFLGAGLYLMAMAAAGYYVRRFGGAWSTFLQAVFFVGAILFLLVPISSATFRAHLRVFVEKSFFKYRYDYRKEWLRFIQITSGSPNGQDLRSRVIEAVCDIVGSPEGALWLASEANEFSPAASWNISRWNLGDAAVIGIDGSLVRFLQQSRWIVSLDEYAAGPERYRGLAELPEWLRSISRAWLIIPLFHRDQLYGIMIVGHSRVRRALTWEDFDILKTVGCQAASLLAQQDADAALAEARQFEAFSKRTAFVAHDIKNLVSQLSLIVSNAAKHGGNVEFQNDVMQTVRQSVEKLNRMLRQLHAEIEDPESAKTVDLAALLRNIVAQRSRSDRAVSLHLQCEAAMVTANENRLKAVIDHLVQNAFDAVGADGRVEVRLREMSGMVAVEVEDNGPGMDAEFVRDRLFRPFDTTKGAGYGIGAYETREYARSLGGRLEVASHPGRGTTMRICIPKFAVNERDRQRVGEIS